MGIVEWISSDWLTPRPEPVPGPLARAVDVQPRMGRAIAIPQESFGLKAVAATFDYRYRHPDPRASRLPCST